MPNAPKKNLTWIDKIKKAKLLFFYVFYPVHPVYTANGHNLRFS